MSTFTFWNGPQGGSGPQAKDLTQFVDAYTNLVSRLNEHIAEPATNTDVHKIQEKLSSVQTDIESILSQKASAQFVDTVNQQVIQNKDSITGINNTLTNHATAIESKATSTDLENKADKSTVTSLSSTVLDIDATLTNVKSDWDEFAKHFNISTATTALFESWLKSAKGLIGRIKAEKVIDFTEWQTFTAPFAGTGGLEAGTNGVYIIGQLSTDWDDSGAPIDLHRHKSGRAYIKNVNTTPFDAIVDMTVTKTGPSEYVGSITAQVSKKAGTWQDMSFHLVHGTDSSPQDIIYLAVSAVGLGYTSTEYTSTNFRAAGVNFIPVGCDGFTGYTNLVTAIATTKISTEYDSVLSVTNMQIANLITNEGTDIVPVGTIVRWAKADIDGNAINVPLGWAACDGSVYDTTRNPKLFDVLEDNTLPIENHSVIKLG